MISTSDGSMPGPVHPDERRSILEVDPGHQVWIDGISQWCGQEKPLMDHSVPLVRRWSTAWWWTWVIPSGDANDSAVQNYGVRVDCEELRPCLVGRYSCLVRGPLGHVELRHWHEFPDPAQIITMAMLAGFDWAPRRP